MMTQHTEAVNAAITLVRRFRELCEARGLARAHRLPLEPGLDDELTRTEEQLIARLTVPKAGSNPAAGESREWTAPGPSALPEELSRPFNSVGLAAPIVGDGGEKPSDIVATIYTDGAAEGNPGPGGYCALVRIAGRADREISGGSAHTTNNKMELTAAIVGLQGAIEANANSLTVISDSEYLIKGITRWLAGWVAKGWLTADKQPVKNRDQWEKLADLTKARNVHWTWVRGHAGHPENEHCDRVATAAARKAAQRGH